MTSLLVYVIEDGYDYEGSDIIAVFDNKKKAWKHLEMWKEKYKADYGYAEELPFGYKFGTHFRVAVEKKLNEDKE